MSTQNNIMASYTNAVLLTFLIICIVSVMVAGKTLDLKLSIVIFLMKTNLL
jgi:hypothetical protein